MKRLLFSLAIIFFSLQLSAQAPKGINYQGVARNSEGKAIASKKITVRISILKNSADGDTEYKETHEVTTNAFGLFTLVIGQGKANTGSFDFISWAVGSKWLQLELDPSGGNSFQLIGSQQLMSVPYALYAQYSGNGLTAGQGISIKDGAINNMGDNDNSTTNELNTSVTFGTDHKLKITDAGGTKEADLSSLIGAAQNLSNVLTTGNDAGNQKITNLALPTAPSDAATKAYVDSHQDADGSMTNEIQDLSLTGNTLKITNNASAASINLSGYLDNTDNQNLALTGNTLSLTNDPTTVDLSPYAQTLSVQAIDANTRSLSISSGNTISIEVGDNDNSSTNELQNVSQVLTQGNDAGGLKLTNLGTPTANSDAATKFYVDNLDATDGDKNSTNELQTLSQVLTQNNDAGGLKLINLGTPTTNSDAATKLYVDNLDAADGDKSATNELQTLSQVLTLNNNAGGISVTNLGTPTISSDAATKQYVDAADTNLASQIATTYAFKTNFEYSNISGLIQNNITLPFTTEEFDDFNVLAINSFTAVQSGTYFFVVEGSYSALSGQISLLYNSVKYPIIIVSPIGLPTLRFSGNFMFKLTAGETITLVGDAIALGGQFTGRFFGYKL